MSKDFIKSLTSVTKVVDLSSPIFSFMPVWPTLPDVMVTPFKNIVRDGVRITLIKMTTHSGTHVEVPAHFLEHGKSLEQIPVERFAKEGIVIDLSSKVKPGKSIELSIVKDYYDEEIREGDVVMLYTGWSNKRGLNAEFLFEWPYISRELAEYLVSKGIKAVGIDTLSVSGWCEKVATHDPVTDEDASIIHKIFLQNNIIIIEDLNNLDRVLEGRKSRRAFFIFAPLLIMGSEAAPCRALALVFKEE